MPTYDPDYLEKLKAGHPLSPREIKEVDFYLELFANHGAAHVFDVASGSAAAARGSCYSPD